MSHTVTGYAYRDPNGEVFVRTVAATRTGAMVNALFLMSDISPALLLSPAGLSDKFKDICPDSSCIVEVEIKVKEVVDVDAETGS